MGASRSRLSPPLKRDAELGTAPMATVRAAGTASPMAQGQAMTSTETETAKGAGQSHHQAGDPDEERCEREGQDDGNENGADAIGELLHGSAQDHASSTRRIIWPRTLSEPTEVARSSRTPSKLSEPPMMRSPGFRKTGRDSR